MSGEIVGSFRFAAESPNPPRLFTYVYNITVLQLDELTFLLKRNIYISNQILIIKLGGKPLT